MLKAPKLKSRVIVLLFFTVSLVFAQNSNFLNNENHSAEFFKPNHSELLASKIDSNIQRYSGYVVSKKTGEPITNAIIRTSNYDTGNVEEFKTDHNGFYSLEITGNTKCKLVVSCHGFSKESQIVKRGEHASVSSRNNRIYLTPFKSLVESDGAIEKIKVEPFNLNYSRFSAGDDKTALQKVLFTMLKFPEIRIKIESHSNAGHSSISNAVLSYFKAKEARRYLILQGIDPNRIESANGDGARFSPKGFNYEQPKSSESEHSDFIIVAN